MAAPFRVKAVYEYSSPHEDDLNFGLGQIITVTDQEDDDWYGGEFVDGAGVKHEGIFPRNFVEKFEPTAPPRPVRTRAKKDPDAAQSSPEEAAFSPSAGPPRADPSLPKHESAEPAEPAEAAPLSPVETATARDVAPPKPAEAAPAPAPPAPASPAPASPVSASPAPSQAPPATLPSPGPKAKPAPPPPASEKPSGNSFKDRIAAFNKPAAPPIAPFKPSGLGGAGGSAGFIKKPFVAPPPSRNAYVPPPRETPPAPVYRREEDAEAKERESTSAEQAERAQSVAAGPPQEGGDDEQPKPTRLKERIALLQKQQMDQAQRHAEAAAKKEKPKKPPKKRSEQEAGATDAPEPPASAEQRGEADDLGTRTSTDEAHPARAPLPPRRKSSKGPSAEAVHDGNDADMSGAGDTTEGQDDTTEREDSDGTSRRVARGQPTSAGATPPAKDEGQEEEDEEDEDEDDEEEAEVDPEVKRKEELRARMAKMSGGMGFHGMFGAPMPPTAAAALKKKPPKAEAAPGTDGADDVAPVSRGAPPVPTLMALPGMGAPAGLKATEESKRGDEDASVFSPRGAPPPVPTRAAERSGNAPRDGDEEEDTATAQAPAPDPKLSRRESSVLPSAPAGRAAPAPPVPSERRAAPPPPGDIKSASDGSESDDELSGSARDRAAAAAARSPPVPLPALHSPVLPAGSPPVSPRAGEHSPTSPTVPSSQKRNSRPPPPIPGFAPAPPPAHSRPPPPPPTGGSGRESVTDGSSGSLMSPTRPPQAGDEENEEHTEYEGDYDTDIASSVPHKDALKAHARDSSLDDKAPLSPATDAPPTLPPPVPSGSAPRGVPPPVPTHPPPPSESSKRRSMEAPRAAPPAPRPPPPPTPRDGAPPRVDEADEADEADERGAPSQAASAAGGFGGAPTAPPPDRRLPPLPAGAAATAAAAATTANVAGGARAAARPSVDAQRPSVGVRQSTDMHRTSTEQGFIAGDDLDLAPQSGWWKQAKQAPPSLQGRRDIRYECEESATTNQGAQTVVTRAVYVLFQDYSQTVVTARFDPQQASEAELEQHYEGPPRALRQDQMEDFHERFGLQMVAAAAAKRDTVVGDGSAQGLVAELLRPLREALGPVGTRSYGALVYANMANASTQQHDVIRAGDIMTVRNGRFQGKHGPMHAKYSMEVGRPDHVAVVAEWDGTKKKVRAWEQGRESRKVKLESFKLDDLRSGEVRIWRVVARSWVGWGGRSS